MSAIGVYLKNIREQKELSTVQVQKLSNNRISQSYVVQVENGDRTPSVAILEAFADVYGVSIHDMIDVMTAKGDKKKKIPLFELSDKEEIELIKQVRKLSVKKQKALITFLSDS
jgi:transcriptional regulator with XRE-family HTH domain